MRNLCAHHGIRHREEIGKADLIDLLWDHYRQRQGLRKAVRQVAVAMLPERDTDPHVSL